MIGNRFSNLGARFTASRVRNLPVDDDITLKPDSSQLTECVLVELDTLAVATARRQARVSEVKPIAAIAFMNDGFAFGSSQTHPTCGLPARA
jgi:hypothetical protein